MRADWDSYQLVIPSVPLHPAPRARTIASTNGPIPRSTITCAGPRTRRAYDAAIVNYTWMSYCLDAVDPRAFKILDAHDVFSGRRDVLRSLEIPPEFFHTTREEEAKGVARANLVWAIKPSEAAYFTRTLGAADCLTVLHADPDRNWWTRPPSSDGWLRVGVIGARNNLNRRNLERLSSRLRCPGSSITGRRSRS